MSISGIGYHHYQNNTTANRRHKTTSASYPSQWDAQRQDNTGRAAQNASVQDIYQACKTRSSSSERVIREEEGYVPAGDGLQTWYGDKTLEEWSQTDPKYTDAKTGFSWYVRDGKHPYMVGEDVEKFKEMCRETGESWLKKFAEMTGMIQQLDDDATAYVGTNGTAIKSKDGKELFIDTSALSYDEIMNLFKNRQESRNYFESGYWQEEVQKAKYSVKDVEVEREGKQNEPDGQKTDTEIIVRPDGSKIMMITVWVGGTETVMSTEITKPTNILEGDSGRTVDDSNVMVSDTSAAIESAPEK